MFTPYSLDTPGWQGCTVDGRVPRFVNQRDGCTMVRFLKYGSTGLKSARKAWGPALSLPGQVQYNN